MIINHCLYGIICLILILSVRPGLSWMVTVPLTWTCTILYGPLVLLAIFFTLPFFLKYHLLWSIIIAPSFLVFSHEVLMDEMFLSLCDGMPICNQWNVEKHVSVKQKIAWAAVPKVECTPACMACMVINDIPYIFFCISNLSPYML